MNWETEYNIGDYSWFEKPMANIVESYIFRGYNISLTVNEMLFGFNSKVAPTVNGGDFLMGNDFALSGDITPVFNDQIGSMAAQ